MPRSADEFKSAWAPDQEVLHLRAEVQDLRSRLLSEKRATGEARLQLLQLAEAIEAAPAVKMQYKAGAPSAAPTTYVLHLTDLHNGEVTERDEVEGFGEFNPDIFNQRLEQLGRMVLDHVTVQRAGINIPTLHILGTGDYVSGDIHRELSVTNAYPVPQQAINCGEALGALIAMLAPHFEKVESDWITLDNHGRLTQKNQSAEGGVNNWGLVVAHVIKKHCSQMENVKVRIHAKPSTIVTIGPERYLCFHGHQIKGWAGLPYYGFERRVKLEAEKRLNVPGSTFTKLCFGHFHVATDMPTWVTGGSLSGTNAFDHGQGRHARPHQTSWMVHAKRGQHSFVRWWLD